MFTPNTATEPLPPAVAANDYIELLLRHLARSPEVFQKARDFHLKGDDFTVSEEYGLVVYKAFVDSILEIGSAPIDPALLAMHVQIRFDSHEIEEDQLDSCEELLAFIKRKQA